MYESIKQHEQKFASNEETLKNLDQTLQGVSHNLTQLSQNMEYLMRKATETVIIDKEKGILEESNLGVMRERSGVYTPPPLRGMNQTPTNPNNHGSNYQVTKLTFPEFNGENPQHWVRRANRFFQLIPMEEGRKVYHAGYYMVGVTDTWYMEYIEGRESITWPDFCNLLMQRFVCPEKEDVVIEFTKLQQTHDVKSYQEKFDELKSLVMVKNPNLSEEFLTSCFLRGLKEELRIPVQLFKPTELNQAINTAKMLESTLDIWGRKNKWGNNKLVFPNNNNFGKTMGSYNSAKKEE